MSDENFVIKIILEAQSKIAPVFAAVNTEADKLKANFMNVSQSADQLDRKMTQLEGHTSKARDTLRSLNPTLDALDRKMKSVRDSATGAATGLDAVSKQGDKASEALAGLVGVAAGLQKKLDQLDRKMTEMGARTYKPKIEVDTTVAEAKVAALAQKLASATRGVYTAKTDVEIGAAMAKVEALRAELEKIGHGDTANRVYIEVTEQMDTVAAEKAKADLVKDVKQAADEARAATKTPFSFRAFLDTREFNSEFQDARAKLLELAGISVSPDVRLGSKEFETEREKVEAQLLALGLKREHVQVILDYDRNDFEAVSNEIGNRLQQIGEDASNRFQLTFRDVVNTALTVAVAFAQPLLSAITGVVGALGALALAAGDAAAGLVGLATAGAAQAAPVLGLLAIAFTRVAAVIKASSLAQQERDKTGQQGISLDKQRTSATNALVSAHEQLATSYRNLVIASQALDDARRQGIRTLQDEIFAEEKANITANQSNISLAEQIASGRGGLIQSAQIQSRQDTVGAQRQRADTGRDLAGGVNGLPAVQQAARGVDDARRAVDDANRALDTAKDNLGDVGDKITSSANAYDIALGKLSHGERILLSSVNSFKKLFTDLDGPVRRSTDTILVSFAHALDSVRKLFENKSVQQAFQSLAGSIASSVTQLAKFFTSGPMVGAIKFFTDEASKNLKPLTSIFEDLVRLFVAVAHAASGPLGVALKAVAGFFHDLADEASSAAGQASLTKFFTDSLKPMQAFARLIGSILNLFLALAGPGGGAEEGTKAINSMASAINRAAAYVDNNRAAVHKFFSESIDVAGQVLRIFGAIGVMLVKTFDPSTVKTFVDFIVKVIIPVFGTFVTILGHVGELLLTIANTGAGRTLIEIAASAGSFAIILTRLAGLLGPIGRLIILMGRLGESVRLLRGSEAFGGLITVLTGPWALAIAGVVAAFVILETKFHFLKTVVKAVKDGIGDAARAIKSAFDKIANLGGGAGAVGITGAFAITAVMIARWEKLHGFVKDIATWFGSKLPGLDSLKNATKSGGGGIKSLFGKAGQIEGIRGPGAPGSASNPIAVAVVEGGAGGGGSGLPGKGKKAEDTAAKDVKSGASKIEKNVIEGAEQGAGFGGALAALKVASKKFLPILGPAGAAIGFVAVSTEAGKILTNKLSGGNTDAVNRAFGGPLTPIQRGLGGIQGIFGGQGGIQKQIGEINSAIAKQAHAGGKTALAQFLLGFAQPGSGLSTQGATEPVLNNIVKGLKKLPPQSRAIGASAVIELAKSMEENGQLPAGNAETIRREVVKQFRGMSTDTANAAVDMFNSLGGTWNQLSIAIFDALSSIQDNALKVAHAMGIKMVQFGLRHPSASFQSKFAHAKAGQEIARGATGLIVPGKATGAEAWTLVDPSGRPKARIDGEELVVANRSTRARVNSMLPPGVTLENEVLSENRPNRLPAMAMGGVVSGPNSLVSLSGVHQGVLNAATKILQKFNDLVITSSTGGQHAKNSFHYLGEALDISGSLQSMKRAAGWVKSSGLYKSLIEGIHNPNLSVSAGKSVNPSFWGADTWAQHANHIHIAVIGALKAFANGGDPTQVGKVSLTGPDGFLKQIGQKTIDRARSAVNRYLSGAIPRGGDKDDYSANYKGGALTQREVENTARSAVRELNLGDMAAWVRTMTRQAFRESTGNPGAVNRTDINAQMGDPSQGLEQITGSNFSKYHLPGFNNILRPLDNIIAAIRYVIDRYGHGDPTQGVNVLWSRGGGAYAGGGELPGPLGRAMPILAHAKEWILNPRQQNKVAKLAGVSRNALKSALGFSGGPDHFQGGGEVPLKKSYGEKGALNVLTDALSNIVGYPNTGALIGAIHKVGTAVSRLTIKGKRNFDEISKAIDYLTASDTSPFAILEQAITDRISQLTRGINRRVTKIVGSGKNVSAKSLIGDQPTLDQLQLGVLGQTREMYEQENEENNRLIAQVRTGLNKKGLSKATRQRLEGDLQKLLVQRGEIAQTLDDNAQSIIQQQQQLQSDWLDSINNNFQRFNDYLGRLTRLNDALGNTSMTGISDAGIIGVQIKAAQSQIGQLQQVLAEAQKTGNTNLANQVQDQISELQTSIVEMTAAQLQSAIDAVNTQAANQLSGNDFQQKLAQNGVGMTGNATANLGRTNFSAQGAALQQRGGILQNQLDQLNWLRAVASSEGNTKSVDDLTNQINTLKGDIIDNSKAIRDNTDAAFDYAVQQSESQGSFFLGITQSAQGIIQALTEQTGVQNTPELQSVLSARGGIIQSLLGSESQSLSELLGPILGVTAGQISGQSTLALPGFLTKLAQQALASGKLDDDQIQAMESLIQSLLGNSQSLIENTTAIQQLTNTTMQSFSSSAWQLFRMAVFNGSGGLLPSFQLPGSIGSADMPTVTPPTSMGSISHVQPSAGSGTDINHIYIENPVEASDPDALADQIGWRLKRKKANN